MVVMTDQWTVKAIRFRSIPISVGFLGSKGISSWKSFEGQVGGHLLPEFVAKNNVLCISIK